MNSGQVADVIQHGKGRMPGFPNIKGNQLDRLSEYLLNGDSSAAADSTTAPATNRGRVSSYDNTGYHKFLDPEGYPANAPPWER
jgi:quinoprotein glucose dehydrogenase